MFRTSSSLFLQSCAFRQSLILFSKTPSLSPSEEAVQAARGVFSERDAIVEDYNSAR